MRAPATTPVEIFRHCLRRYWSAKDSVSVSTRTGNTGFKELEYCADFERLAERNLNKQQFRLFRDCLLGEIKPFQFASRERITHLDARILRLQVQERMGAVYAAVKPYPLYPFGLYFAALERRQSRVA